MSTTKAYIGRESWRADAAELMRLVASHLETMARALDEDDDILGALAGMGLANHLPMLPKHIRDVLMENLDDEAARGVRAEALYYEEMYPGPGRCPYCEPGEPCCCQQGAA